MQSTGLVLYEGPSVLDAAPIVAILTLHSRNHKTGDMAQTWIMRRDMGPKEAIEQGADASVCGACPHRHATGGACYVIPWQAPQRIYQAYQRGGYPRVTRRHVKRLAGRAIRLGAYGDPAAVPFEVWAEIAAVARMATGYTHQIQHPNFDKRLLGLCMVSVDSEADYHLAQVRGHPTFRVKRPDQPLLKGEVYCPASVEKDVQCLDCGLCSGRGASVAINAHGPLAGRNNIPLSSIA